MTTVKPIASLHVKLHASYRVRIAMLFNAPTTVMIVLIVPVVTVMAAKAKAGHVSDNTIIFHNFDTKYGRDSSLPLFNHKINHIFSLYIFNVRLILSFIHWRAP